MRKHNAWRRMPWAFSIILIFCPGKTGAQDKVWVASLIDTLSSPYFHGRGYVNNGDGLAAGFIAEELRKYGLKPFDAGYFQSFAFGINTLPDTVEVKINGNELVPGRDYVVFASGPPVKGKFKVVWLPDDTTLKELPSGLLNAKKYHDKFILTDISRDRLKKAGPVVAKGIIYLTDKKPGWHVMPGMNPESYTEITISKAVIPAKIKRFELNVHSRFLSPHRTQNVVAYVEGSLYPDSFLVFTAHYDHLGRMGSETYFPGANDNASGTAMVLDLARHYSKPENRPAYSIAFMFFAAEEAGLLGSTAYTLDPVFPLEQISFLVNLDMVGSGSAGITVVNGEAFLKEYEMLVKINSNNEYIRTVKKRGVSANSDHHPFYAKGVRAVFIYSMGDESKEYHTIDDTPANAPLTEYEDIFRLLTDFVKGYK